MVNVPDYTPITALRRHADSPLLWVSFIIGSLLLHVLLFLVLRVHLLRQAKVEVMPAPIAVEFVERPSRNATRRNSAMVQTTSPRATRSVRGDRPSQSGRSPQTESVPAPSSPSIATAPPMTTRQPEVEPSPVRPAPAPEPRPVQRPAPVTPPRRRSEDGNQAAVPAPAPASPLAEEGTETNGPSTDAGAPNQTDDQGPVASGVPLPRTQSSATVVVLGSPYQKQDRKAQPARPQQSSREVPLYYPRRVSQPIEIEAHLEIDQNGKMLKVLNVEQLNPEVVPVEAEQLRSLADQIFATWDFAPAQDGTPPAPVLSDLFIRVRITLGE